MSILLPTPTPPIKQAVVRLASESSVKSLQHQLDICEVKARDLVRIGLALDELEEKVIGDTREKALQVDFAKALSF